MKSLRIMLVASLSIAMAACGAMGTSTGTATQNQSGGNTVGNILGAILGGNSSTSSVTSILSNVIGLGGLTEESIIGTWKYSNPGCAFTTENLLAKAGGAVAASKIKGEMAPTYQKLGFNAENTQITLNEDKTFSLNLKGIPMSGTYTLDTEKSKLNLKGALLSIPCYVNTSTKEISLLFESKQLLKVLQTAATLSGNTSLQVLSDLSKNYDGVRLGMEFSK